MNTPRADQVIKVLFENFCERCELGEEGCIRVEASQSITCPVFNAAQSLCPDNHFVRRIIGKYMRCPKCTALGMSPPTSSFNAPVQPVFACPNCGAGLWRDAYGVMVDDPLLAGREPELIEIGGEGELKLRVRGHRPPEQAVMDEAENILERGQQ